ncbi:hypothetical protein [Reyranella sp.]|uniref:hypothetical protein n=1 Tax=Reyranella sp. TaxID=1929291 RepID=UPI003F720873
MTDTTKNATCPQLSALPGNAAQSLDAHRSGSRPSGLPIFCTERLNASEVGALNRLSNAHREQAELLQQALAGGTVTGALATMMVGVRLGQIEAEFSRLLGSNR